MMRSHEHSSCLQCNRCHHVLRLLETGGKGSRHTTTRTGVFSVQCGGRTLFLRAPSTAEAEVHLLPKSTQLFT